MTSRGAIEVTYGSATGFSDDSPSQAFTGQLPGGFNVNWMANGLAVGYFDDDCFADIITDERLINDYADLLVLSGSAGGVDLSSPRTILQTDLTPSNPGSLLGEAWSSVTSTTMASTMSRQGRPAGPTSDLHTVG